MKRFRLLIIALLAVGLLLGAAPAYADDEDENGIVVDIVVIGDDSDVGLGVIGNDTNTEVNTKGENAEVIVNGRSVWDMLNDAARDHGSSFTVVIDKWSRWRIEEVIFPWMDVREKLIGLLTDGLAKNIVLTTDRYTGNMALLDRANKLEEKVEDQDVDLLNLKLGALRTDLDEGLVARQKISEENYYHLVEYIDARYAAAEREQSRKWTITVVVFSSLMVILIAFCAVGFRRKMARKC